MPRNEKGQCLTALSQALIPGVSYYPGQKKKGMAFDLWPKIIDLQYRHCSHRISDSVADSDP